MAPGQVWWLIAAKMPKDAIEKRTAMDEARRMVAERKALKNGGT